MNAGNGGLYAGTYDVVAHFEDSNSANYEAIDDMEATLTITQANYLAYYEQKNGVDELAGFKALGTSYNFDTTANHKPTIEGVKLTNPADFEVRYEYYWSKSAQAYTDGEITFLTDGTADEIDRYSTDDNPLIRDAGYYTVIAKISYLNPLYANNFAEIKDEEATIHIIIEPGTVDGVKVNFVAGYDYKVYLGETFDYTKIASIEVHYEGNENKPAVITLPERIALMTVLYGSKQNNAGVDVEQKTFWHVGDLALVFTYAETNTLPVTFHVVEEISEVTVMYSTEANPAEEDYRNVPEDGLNLRYVENYKFVARHEACDVNGDRTYVYTELTLSGGSWKRGRNTMTANSTYYEFGAEATAKFEVIAYEVIEQVTWQYSADGGKTWKNLDADALDYIGKAYQIRVSFEVPNGEGTRTVRFDAHTYDSAEEVLNAGLYHLEVGLVKKDASTQADLYYYIDVRRDLTIEKVVLELTWAPANGRLTYNAQQQTATATASNLPEAVAGEEIEFTYSYTNESGNAVTPANVLKVGTYTVWLSLNEEKYPNYTLNGSSTASSLFRIVKANPLEGVSVQYSEYATANTTYQNNPQGLRANKLVANFASNAKVDGEFRILKSYNAEDNSYELYASVSEMITALLSTAGTKSVQYVYIPADENNYDRAYGSVTVTVQAQAALDELSVEYGVGAIRFYLVDQTVSTIGLNVYMNYASYYVEDGVAYGYRELLTPITDYSMTIRNSAADGYKIRQADKENGYIQITAATRTQKTGMIRIPVTDKQPVRLEIEDETALKGIWYVGETFSYGAMKFTAYYDDGETEPTEGLMEGTITSDCDRYTFTANDVGKVEVTFEFFGVSVSATIEVRAKEDLVVITSEDQLIRLPYADGAELEAPALKFMLDGVVVTKDDIEGVDYSVTVSGKGTKLSAVGEYTVIYRFTIDNPRFKKDRGPVTLRVEVTEIHYICEIEVPTEGMKQVYKGSEYESHPWLATVTNVKNIITNETLGVSRYEVEYKVNGDKYEDGTGMLTEVGKYTIEVIVLVMNENGLWEEIDSKTYQYEITKADNKVSVTVNNIKYGEAVNPVIECLFGNKADVVLKYSKTNSASAVWTTTVPKEVGVYYVKAELKGDDKNYNRYVTPTDEVKRFVINQAELKTEEVNGEGNPYVVVDGGAEGIAPGITLKADQLVDEALNEVSVSKHVVVQGYAISWVDAENKEVQPDREMTVSIALSEELYNIKDLKVYSIGADGSKVELKAKLSEDGKRLEFTTSTMTTVAIAFKAATVPIGLIIGVIIGAVAAAGMIVACVLVFVKKRGKQ